jgi:hypothetical protein
VCFDSQTPTAKPDPALTRSHTCCSHTSQHLRKRPRRAESGRYQRRARMRAETASYKGESRAISTGPHWREIPVCQEVHAPRRSPGQTHWTESPERTWLETLPITVPNESKKTSLLPTFPHILWTGKTQGILVDARIRWTLRSYPVGKIIAVNRTDWKRLTVSCARSGSLPSQYSMAPCLEPCIVGQASRRQPEGPRPGEATDGEREPTWPGACGAVAALFI